MDERRKDLRDKVIYGGVASVTDGAATDCVVRNISERGARIEFKSGLRAPKDKLALTIARKGCSYDAKTIWHSDNVIGVAFTDKSPDTSATSDLEERLRKSEVKKRQLQRQIRNLLGEG